MIKWGIMATGNIAHKFAATVCTMKGETELVACSSGSLEKAKAFAEEFSITRFYGSYEEMLKDDEVDVVYIATPNSMHLENIRMCIKAGKHVLCEKPITTNASDAEMIFSLARQNGVFLMEAFWISMLPMHLKIKELIEAGKIGEVQHIRADYGFTIDESRRKRKFDAELGGGALLDIGIYNIGFVSMHLGYSPSNIKSSVRFNEFGTDEFETMIFEYEDGKTATLTVSIGMRIDKEGVIYGTLGSIKLPDFQKAEKMYINYYDGRSEVIDMPVEINGFEYQIREAVSSIQDRKLSGSIQTPDKTISVMKIMDAVRRDWIK